MSNARNLANLLGTGTQVTTADIADGVFQANKNLIINGAMQVAARGTSQTGITSGGYKDAPDRFRIDATTVGTWTVSQSTTAPEGFSNSYKFECTTANGSLSADSKLSLLQRIEGQNLQQLKKGTSNSESVTLSFWVRSSKTGTYIVQLKDQDNTRIYSQAYTISSANTWEYKTLTYAGDTTGSFDNDNGDSFRVFWWLVAGTDFSSGTLATAWESNTNANRAVGQVNLADTVGNDWYITGVQLEVGEQATPFEHRSYADELRRCDRYFQSYDLSGNYVGLSTAYVNNSTTGSSSMTFRTPMRASPTMSFNNLIVTDRTAFDSDVSQVTVQGSSSDGVSFRTTHASNSASLHDGVEITSKNNTTDAYARFDAEL